MEIYFDARLNVIGTKHLKADARAIVPASDVDYSDLSITLGAHTLSDTFNMSAPLLELDIDYEVKGTLKDFNFNFKVEEITESNGRFSYTGRYSTDKLKYTNYRLNVTWRTRRDQTPPQSVSMPVKTIITLMAQHMGLTVNYQAWNWSYPLPQISAEEDTVVYGLSGTYGSLISQLFGWLSDLPHVDFNVFIRGSVLNVIQRGQETGNTYDLSNDYHLGFPYSIHKRRVRTEWQGNADWPQDEYDDPDNQEPFTGTIEFNPCRITYENGYLVREVNDTGAETTYEYVDLEDVDGNTQKYLSLKETTDSESGTCSKTLYDYSYFGDEIYLSQETTWVNGDYSNGSADYTDADISRTTNTPLGNGWYGHTTYDEDGEVTNTGLSQGAPGQTVSQYMVDKTQNNFKSEAVAIAEIIIQNLVKYAHPPLISTTYPVKDQTTIKKLVSATDWLDNKIEERVTVEVLNSEHIFDFNDIIRFRGSDYKLESNSVRHSAENGLRQGLELVRWY